jgi:hypothetical protein
MDIYCHVCGEPYDQFEVTDNFTYRERQDFHAGRGCPACKWGKLKPEKKPFRAELAAAVSVLSGEDIDGLASDMEDAAFLFGDEFWD